MIDRAIDRRLLFISSDSHIHLHTLSTHHPSTSTCLTYLLSARVATRTLTFGSPAIGVTIHPLPPPLLSSLSSADPSSDAFSFVYIDSDRKMEQQMNQRNTTEIINTNRFVWLSSTHCIYLFPYIYIIHRLTFIATNGRKGRTTSIIAISPPQ